MEVRIECVPTWALVSCAGRKGNAGTMRFASSAQSFNCLCLWGMRRAVDAREDVSSGEDHRGIPRGCGIPRVEWREEQCANDANDAKGITGGACHPERQRGLQRASLVASHEARTQDPSLTLGMTSSLGMTSDRTR